MLPKVKTFRAFIILMTLTLITGCRKYSLTDGTPLTTPRSVISQSLSPIADAYVQDGAYAFSNYGTAQWLIAKKDSPGYQRESYLKFDLSGLPASAFNMGSATLRLTGGVTGPDTANAKWVYYATASKQWTENGITWNNAPRDGQQIGEVPGTIKTTGSTVDFNIPQSVMQAAWQSDKILSIRIIMQPRNSSVPGSFYSDFASKEATNTTYKPQLLFNYAELEAPGYVPNIVMDEITYDSILLDLIASGSARYLISTQVTTKANQALTATPAPAADVTSLTNRNNAIQDGGRVFALALQWFLNQQDTAGYNYVNKAKQYLLSWAAVNNPTSHTPNETAMLDFFKGYSIIRQQIDAYSRSFIDAWLTNRFNYFKTLSVRTNNWETIKNLFFVDIAYILGNQEMTNYARNAFLQHHNINYRADGASLDFLGRDAFAYHAYDMNFTAPLIRTMYIYEGRNKADSLVYHRSNNWTGNGTLGGSLMDALLFMKPYMVDPQNNVHLEFVNTEWEPDRDRSDYGQPLSPSSVAYALHEVLAVARNQVEDIFAIMYQNNTRHSRGLAYYLNSFSRNPVNPYPAKITLYGNTSYSGWYKELGIGQYTLASLQAMGVINDQASSVAVPPGLKVTLYQHDNYLGNAVVLTSNTINLSTLSFNEITSSLKVEAIN